MAHVQVPSVTVFYFSFHWENVAGGGVATYHKGKPTKSSKPRTGWLASSQAIQFTIVWPDLTTYGLVDLTKPVIRLVHIMPVGPTKPVRFWQHWELPLITTQWEEL